MKTLQQMNYKLQRKERKQASLYLFCNFISLMLITAYSIMMFSDTVQKILPEGGDSRKQMYAIFILALFGCVIFTIYAASLFFRKKSRQLGIMMALGASKKRLAPGIFREVFMLSASSSILGILAGFPFLWIIWNGFRLFLVDSPEMDLQIDFSCLWISFAFLILVIFFSCITAYWYLNRTNIMDVVHEEHRNEPLKQPGHWCGPVGILLLLGGAILGYYSGSIYIYLLKSYPPAWLNVTYLPVFIGLYMIMLHTVVYGWGNQKRHPYKNIIARSMMKFQGKQTVYNLLVSAVLIAGACFALFYLPMLSVSSIIETKTRNWDYFFQYRADQHIPDREAVEKKAQNYNVTLKDWNECSYITLALDGTAEVEDGRKIHEEYLPLFKEGKFISEKTYEAISKQQIEVPEGTYYGIVDENSGYSYAIVQDCSTLTNMCTMEKESIQFGGLLQCDILTDNIGYYVLNSSDYDKLSVGLTDDWKGNFFFFNIGEKDSYDFAADLFHAFVNSFEKDCEKITAYDRVEKYVADQSGKTYWGDTDAMTKISFSHPDSTDFRIYWMYMPKIRIMDQNDFLRTFAVFLMIFLFITIICMLAAMIIFYTRCQTIALNNRYLFEDLKRLGASPQFLSKEVKIQCKKVFAIPSAIGMIIMYLLYIMIMYANDGKIQLVEIVGLLFCLALILLFTLLIYGVYVKTLKSIHKQLGIPFQTKKNKFK